MLVCSDLDRTLIYSASAVAGLGDGRHHHPLVVVERYQDADASWMTARAASALSALRDRVEFVPATTRTPEQWRRITLPGPAPRHVITANGGVLLVDGVPDADWTSAVTTALRPVAPLADVFARAGADCRPEWTTSLRCAADLFCYAVLDRPAVPDGFVDAVSEWARELGWQVSLQGRKLYWVPVPLTKSAALAEVAARIGATGVVAAGDSLLDADLLLAADAGIAARHGELVASGWTAPSVQVTAARGVLAGEEIVDWFGARAGTPAG